MSKRRGRGTTQARHTLNCGFCMMLRHAVSTSMLRSFFSVLGKLEPLHMTIEFVPSLSFRTNPPFGPTVSSAPSLIWASSASLVIFGHASPVAGPMAEGLGAASLTAKNDELFAGRCVVGGAWTNGEAPAAAIFAAHSSRVFGH